MMHVSGVHLVRTVGRNVVAHKARHVGPGRVHDHVHASTIHRLNQPLHASQRDFRSSPLSHVDTLQLPTWPPLSCYILPFFL